jgi:hypothetical protein
MKQKNSASTVNPYGTSPTHIGIYYLLLCTIDRSQHEAYVVCTYDRSIYLQRQQVMTRMNGERESTVIGLK